MYVQVTRGAAPREFGLPADVPPTVLAYVQAHVFPSEAEIHAGIAVHAVEDQRWARCDIKSTNLLPAVLAKERPGSRGPGSTVRERRGDGARRRIVERIPRPRRHAAHPSCKQPHLERHHPLSRARSGARVRSCRCWSRRFTCPTCPAHPRYSSLRPRATSCPWSMSVGLDSGAFNARRRNAGRGDSRSRRRDALPHRALRAATYRVTI